MSATQIVASDYPLPRIETEHMYIGHRDFPHGKDGEGMDEADGYIKKKYKYRVLLAPNERCVSLFRNYLDKHMKNNSEVELWSIWLGTGCKNYYKYRPQLRSIGPAVYDEVFDAMDDYVDGLPAIIKKRVSMVKELTQEDILYFYDNLYVCVSIRKQ